MKFYYSSISPFVRKVSLMLAELGLDNQVERVATQVSPGEINASYAEKNPLIQVPALETESGLILSDSHAICTYLVRMSKDDFSLFPLDKGWEEAVQFYTLVNGATEAMVQCAYETVCRPEQLRWQAYLDGRMSIVQNVLAAIASFPDQLGVGDRLTYNQIALICLLDYCDRRSPNPNWRKHTRLVAFHDTVSGRDAVLATFPKS